MAAGNKFTQVGPWLRKSKVPVYDNPWITVSHEEVVTPSATEGIYGTVHFKHRALGIVALDIDKNTYLVGQYRYALDAFSWEIPEGGGALNEEPLLAAQRELKEETGLHNGQWQKLFSIHTSNSVTDEQGCIYYAYDLEQGEQQLEPSEGDLVVKKVPFEQAIEMVFTGEITDLMSISGLLAVERLLLNR